MIKKLKVLDGISIEPSEQQVAKDQFTGRLTEEILQSKLCDKSASEVIELDLSNCKLRDFEDVFQNTHFQVLAELNLSGNLFQSTRMLGFLPSLKILILNSNKIETLFCNSDINVKKGLNGCQVIGASRARCYERRIAREREGLWAVQSAINRDNA